MPKMQIRVELPSQYSNVMPLSYRRELSKGFCRRYRIDNPSVTFPKEQPLFESHNTLIGYMLFGEDKK